MKTRNQIVIAERAIAVEIEVRRAELASLERAADILKRKEDDDHCDRHSEASPCYGQVYSRWCRRCGAVIRRCEEHGSIRSATIALSAHRKRHGGEDARRPAPDHASGMLAARAAVPVGRVPASPAGRGYRASGGAPHASDQPTAQRAGADHQARPTQSPAVIRRKRTGADVDR